MGLSRRFRDKTAISVENRKLSHPVHFTPPLTGFSLEFGIGARCQKLE